MYVISITSNINNTKYSSYVICSDDVKSQMQITDELVEGEPVPWEPERSRFWLSSPRTQIVFWFGVLT